VTSHSQALAGLTAGTLYHYRVHSKNSSGVESISGDFAFATNNTTDTHSPDCIHFLAISELHSFWRDHGIR
jgi:hypothetical protein